MAAVRGEHFFSVIRDSFCTWPQYGPCL